MVIDLVLVKDFNVFIWMKVDGTANHGYLAVNKHIISLDA